MALGDAGSFDWRTLYRKLGVSGKLFAAVLVLWTITRYAVPAGLAHAFLSLALFLVGAWVAVRVARWGIRRIIWRLRNRLYVAYLFIAVVPVCLIVVLTGVGAYIFTSQVAVYLVTSELDRRTMALRGMAEWLSTASDERRNESFRQMASFSTRRYPGLEILIRDKSELRFPEGAKIERPPEGWGLASGVINKNGELYAWAHAVAAGREVTLMAPLTFDYLSELIPHLGAVSYLPFVPGSESQKKGGLRFRVGDKEVRPTAAPNREALPPAVNRFDMEVDWITLVPAAVWRQPRQNENVALQIRTRFSAVLRTLTGPQADTSENFAAIVFLATGILFLLVEIGALFIGISLTRTITGAVHNLYEGTQKVRVGNFAHRIEVNGNDQLAELGVSFNKMTENLEQLVLVAKEKERLQAELELASEVQAQLYPKALPEMKTLRLIAACTPARIVSGDYFDYQTLHDDKVAIAMGDVAGKGISAALLMATVGSSMRTQLRNCMDQLAKDGGASRRIPTSHLVAQLNRQIFNDTAPEKYLTFYFGIYDDASGRLDYTNAGHLPPIVIRDGEAIRLDVNGTVVGAFPFSEYGESSLQLQSGDLLVCYTDGITEPENDYGEMFGDERLIEVLVKNYDRGEQDLVDAVMEAVQSWTGSPELQDDMTMLIARRL